MPQIDLIRLAIVAFLTIAFVALLGFLLGSDIGAATGRAAFDFLGTDHHGLTWNPMDVFHMVGNLIRPVGLPDVQLTGIISTVFNTALIAVFVALLMKAVRWVLG